jgi:hypothetical protein
VKTNSELQIPNCRTKEIQTPDKSGEKMKLTKEDQAVINSLPWIGAKYLETQSRATWSEWLAKAGGHYADDYRKVINRIRRGARCSLAGGHWSGSHAVAVIRRGCMLIYGRSEMIGFCYDVAGRLGITFAETDDLAAAERLAIYDDESKLDLVDFFTSLQVDMSADMLLIKKMGGLSETQQMELTSLFAKLLFDETANRDAVNRLIETAVKNNPELPGMIETLNMPKQMAAHFRSIGFKMANVC